MASSRQSVPDRSTVFAVLELVHIKQAGKGSQVQLLVSRPGSSVIVRNSWTSPGPCISASQLEDLLSKVQALVSDATIMWCGVQEDLPGM